MEAIVAADAAKQRPVQRIEKTGGVDDADPPSRTRRRRAAQPGLSAGRFPPAALRNDIRQRREAGPWIRQEDYLITPAVAATVAPWVVGVNTPVKISITFWASISGALET